MACGQESDLRSTLTLRTAGQIQLVLKHIGQGALTLVVTASENVPDDYASCQITEPCAP